MQRKKTTWENAEESKTKRCGFAKGCDKPAVGVISYAMFHTYVCREHAKVAEQGALHVSYHNWRL